LFKRIGLELPFIGNTPGVFEVFSALSVLSLNQLAPESFVGKHHANCTISFFS
jgi:hypothetical protein